MLIAVLKALNWKDYYDLYVSEFAYDTGKEKQEIDNKYDLLKLNSNTQRNVIQT